MASKDCLEWRRYASMDIDAAQLLYSQQQNPRQRPIEIILYHCQQGAEKALKAFMVQNGYFPPKIHDLNDLRLICIQWDAKFDSVRIVNHCDFLDPFSVVVRYPNFYNSLDSSHAVRGLNSAKRIYDFVSERLGLQKVYTS
ncbi:MAG: HEPN domain-containing protein [Clostridiales bacterium]|nr:HEPN domain-containing protein [Clostridiales bacterium]